MVVLMRVLFTASIAAALLAAPAFPRAGAQPPRQTVAIAAERFSFSPSEVKTRVGTELTITLTSDDTAHGFRIVGSDVNIEIPKRGRGSATVTFTPDKPGRYVFECSQLCGAGHSFMRGVIVVSESAGEGR
jgi:cytochrome c oxidase subunit 2